MQAQDYLPYFQNLLTYWYQFTLANSAYAICLSITVWLLTSILYSISIASLNRRNGSNLNALLEAQAALATAQQQNQLLQEELATEKARAEQANAVAEQETQRAAGLLERISQLDKQLAESLQDLTEGEADARPLPAEGLKTEELWRRLSKATKRLQLNFGAEQYKNNELQQAVNVETAKAAEKDQQLQLQQIRVDSQSQQIAKLEAAIAEQQILLTQQQQNEQLRLSELETRHQADLARLAALEQQASTSTWRQAIQQPAPTPEPTVVLDIPLAAPEPATTVEITELPAQTPVSEPEPIPATVAVAAEPQTSANVAEPSTAAPRKFKSLFDNAFRKTAKPDEKSAAADNPVRQQAQPNETDSLETGLAAFNPASKEDSSQQTKAQSSANPLSGKLKNLFSSAKDRTGAEIPERKAEPQATLSERQLEAAAPAEIPKPTSTDAVAEKTAPVPGKLKNLFANAMQQIGKLDAKLEAKLGDPNDPAQQQNPDTERDQRLPEAPAPNAETQTSASAPTSGAPLSQDKLKEHFGELSGKFTKLFASAKPATAKNAEVPDQKPADVLEAEAEPQPTVTAETAAGKLIPGQLKRLFGKNKGSGK